jgi:lysophospholipase L1-like esterase
MRLFFFLCLCFFSFPAAQAQLEIDDPVRFLALGDSYTIGESVPPAERWPVQLADSLSKRGFSVEVTDIIATTGWTTTNLLNAIDAQDPAANNYNLVSLLIGVNNQYQGIDFNTYEPQFRQLLDSAIVYAGGDTSGVFVVSIPDYAYTPFGQNSGNADQISAELDTYNAMNKSIAEEYGITYFNITPISREGLDDPELVANDNLHPSGKQYTRWVELMLANLDSTTATEEQLQISLTLFPSPTSDLLTIKTEGLPADSHFILQDSTGKTLLKFPAAPSGTTHVNVEDFAKGIYFIQVIHQNSPLARAQVVIQ